MRKDFDRCYVTGHGNVAVVTLNHPEVLNAASPRLVAGMIAALRYVARGDSGFRATIITGEGRAFCSGANLSELDDAVPPAEADTLHVIYNPLLRRLRDLPMPIVTAVSGACAGIGMGIALLGDIVIADRSAYFLQAFTRIGLSSDGGSSWILPRLIGLARARELALLARKLPAEKAVEWGLISQVVDDGKLMDEAMELARGLADGPTVALNLMRRLYQASSHNSFEEQLDLETRFQREACASADFAEGVAAFAERRPAQFTGR